MVLLGGTCLDCTIHANPVTLTCFIPEVDASSIESIII